MYQTISNRKRKISTKTTVNIIDFRVKGFLWADSVLVANVSDDVLKLLEALASLLVWLAHVAVEQLAGVHRQAVVAPGISYTS